MRAARALGEVGTSSEADATDWTSLTSFYGAIGRRRVELALVLEGLARFPESDALRTTLARARSGAARARRGAAAHGRFVPQLRLRPRGEGDLHAGELRKLIN